MVTAGVYLLMRTSPLIEYSSTVLILCLWIGAITTVFSSLIGLFQQDIKKVIAYSTMSQLGMMVIAVGLSSYNLALFHLINHAFYKGLLFLGAGAVIHAWADNQDFRKYGGLRPFLPLTYSVMLIASLSLVAFPFMTGFYSKDFILESTFGQFYFSSTVVYFIATIGAMFTTLYSVKVLYLTFLTNPNGPLINYKQVHEGDIFMSLPLIILAIFSIFFGYLTKDIFIGLGSNFFADNSLFIHPTHEIMLDTEFAVPSLLKLLPLIFTVSLTAISLILPEFFSSRLISFKFSRIGYNIFGFLNQRFLIELFYNKYITGIIFKLGGQTTRVLDKGSVELVGPFGLEKVLVNLSRNISSLDTGVITSYALYILIGLIFYMLMPYIWLTDSSLFLLIIFSLSIAINIDKKEMSSKKIDVTNSYTFVSLPLQSKVNFIPTWLTKHFTPKKVLILFSIFLLSWAIRMGFKELDIILINSDVLFSISSFTTIFSSSFLRAYLENLVGDVSWSSIYYFITSSNKEKWGVISNFLEVLKSSKGNGGGGLMHSGVKSPIPCESYKHMETVTNLHMDSSNPGGGPVFDLAEYLDLLHETSNLRDSYTSTFKRLCRTYIDENSPLPSAGVQTLIDEDNRYFVAKRQLQLMHRDMPARVESALPLSNVNAYAGSHDGLESTRTIRNLAESVQKTDSIRERLSYVYNLKNHEEVLAASKGKTLSSGGRGVVKELTQHLAVTSALKNKLLVIRANEDNLFESFLPKNN